MINVIVTDFVCLCLVLSERKFW